MMIRMTLNISRVYQNCAIHYKYFVKEKLRDSHLASKRAGSVSSDMYGLLEHARPLLVSLTGINAKHPGRMLLSS